MAKITQYSRISHHTIAGSASAGLTFSVPAQEDFTDGSWTPYDLALSEIGVNEQDDKVYIRIDDEIKEFAFVGASGVGFTGGPGNCITDLYLTNMYGCSPITIHDDFIQKDGTSVNSEDSNLQITFDAGGVGTFDVQKINGVTTQLERLTVGIAGIQIQTVATNSNVSGFILCEDTNQNGTDINIQLESISVPDSSRIQLGPSSSFWLTSDGTTYDNRITINTTDMLFKADDISNIKYGELQLTHNFTYFAHYNNGLLSLIQAQDNTIDIQTQGSGALNKVNLDSSTETIEISSLSSGGAISDITMISTGTPSITLRTEDNTSSVVSTGTLTPGDIKLNIDVLGLISSININVNDIVSDVNEYIKQSSINGSQKILRGTQQYVGEAQDNAQTTDATPVAGSVVFPDFAPVLLTGTTSCWFEVEVLGFGATNSKAYGAKLFGVFKRTGGTVTQVSTTDKVEKTDFSTATSDFNISGNQISLQVTGEAATDIDWNMSYRWKIQTQL